MTATVIDLTDRMASANVRTRRTIQALLAYRGIATDRELADLMGMGRTKVNNYLTGATRMSVEMLAAFGVALGVPDYVLAMPSDAAFRWVLDNAPNGPDDPAEQAGDRSSCTSHSEETGADLLTFRRSEPKKTAKAA